MVRTTAGMEERELDEELGMAMGVCEEELRSPRELLVLPLRRAGEEMSARGVPGARSEAFLRSTDEEEACRLGVEAAASRESWSKGEPSGSSADSTRSAFQFSTRDGETAPLSRSRCSAQSSSRCTSRDCRLASISTTLCAIMPLPSVPVARSLARPWAQRAPVKCLGG